jgi:hypothetical protein
VEGKFRSEGAYIPLQRSTGHRADWRQTLVATLGKLVATASGGAWLVATLGKLVATASGGAWAETADKGCLCLGGEGGQRVFLFWGQRCACVFLARGDYSQRQSAGSIQADLGIKGGTHWGIS